MSCRRRHDALLHRASPELTTNHTKYTNHKKKENAYKEIVRGVALRGRSGVIASFAERFTSESPTRLGCRMRCAPKSTKSTGHKCGSPFGEVPEAACHYRSEARGHDVSDRNAIFTCVRDPREFAKSNNRRRFDVSRLLRVARSDAKRSRLDAKVSRYDAKRSRSVDFRSHSVDFQPVVAADVKSRAST